MFKTFAEVDRTDLYENINIDEATQALIYDWYQYREICAEEDKFKNMFRRKLNLDAEQYNQLIRLQFTEFDPLVNSYHESLTQNEAETANAVSEETGHTATGSTSSTDSKTIAGSTSSTDSKTIAGSTSSTDSKTIADDIDSVSGGNSTESGTHSGTVEVANNGSESTSESNNDDVKNITRQFPVTTAYANATATSGMPSVLDWTHASGQEETKSDGSRSGTRTTSDGSTTESDLSDSKSTTEASTTSTDSTRTEEGESATTDSRTEEGESATTDSRTEEGESATTDSRNESGTRESTSTGTTESETRYISTGRDGLTPQEALKTAMEYIKKSDAFDWLRLELDECFIMVYDI